MTIFPTTTANTLCCDFFFPILYFSYIEIIIITQTHIKIISSSYDNNYVTALVFLKKYSVKCNEIDFI